MRCSGDSAWASDCSTWNSSIEAERSPLYGASPCLTFWSSVAVMPDAKPPVRRRAEVRAWGF